MKALPPVDLLREVWDYDPKTGILKWKPRTPELMLVLGGNPKMTKAFNTRFAGRPAGNVDKNGYYSVGLPKENFFAHRIAYAIYHGSDPKAEIDHINGDPADNRISNLRRVTHQENHKNTKLRVDNTSGVVGVYRERKTGKWRAVIVAGGVLHQLGRFDCFERAVRARKRAEIEYNFHPNHGRVAVDSAKVR